MRAITLDQPALLAIGCDSCPPEEYTRYEQELLEVDPELDAEFVTEGSTVDVIVGDLTFNFHPSLLAR